EAEYATNEDRQQMTELRIALRRQRQRIRCLRCRKKIPETRRIVARYCSVACHSAHRREELTALRSECRQAVRTSRPCAECGIVLPPPRSGLLPRYCKRCRDRLASRRRSHG